MNLKPDGDLNKRYQQFLLSLPRQQAVLADDQAWSWIDTGAGQKTLLLLPGFLGEAETSFLYILALAERMRVVSVSHPPSVGQVCRFCDGLCGLLDHLGIQQVTVLGGSSGGFFAQAFVRHAPARTNGLILTHTGLPNLARARTVQRVLRLLHLLPFEILRPLLLLSVFCFFPSLTPVHGFWRAHFRWAIRGLSREALLNRFRLVEDFHRYYRFRAGDLALEPGSTLLMEMQPDHLSSLVEQSEMRALYDGAKLHIFSDVAHYDSVKKPDEQIRVIADFIDPRNSSCPTPF